MMQFKTDTYDICYTEKSVTIKVIRTPFDYYHLIRTAVNQTLEVALQSYKTDDNTMDAPNFGFHPAVIEMLQYSYPWAREIIDNALVREWNADFLSAHDAVIKQAKMDNALLAKGEAVDIERMRGLHFKSSIETGYFINRVTLPMQFDD